MSQLIIRDVVRSILLETRSSLAFIPILKGWIKVAAEYGERTDPYIEGPGGLGRAQTACLKVPKSYRHRVFDNFTPELQEYILKHWRSREYFSRMIAGVSIGIVKAYKKSNWAGMKSGSTTMSGGIDDDGKIIGTMSGYLTAKLAKEAGWSWEPAYGPHLSAVLTSQGEINRDHWKKMLFNELKKRGGSTMVHEFQHWFQESIYYTTNREKTPTDSKDIRKTKKTKPNFRDLKKIQLMLAKEAFSGVDWNTTMKVRGATAYKLTDPVAFFDSLGRENLGDTVSILDLAFEGKSTLDAESLAKVILHDYLKLQKWIDSNDISELVNNMKSTRNSNFPFRVRRMLSDKNAYETHSPRVQSLQSYSTIMILKSSDFYKNGELKPNKDPSKPTNRNIPKAEWVLISRGRQRLPSKKSGSSLYAMERDRGISNPGNKWTDRWVEFDAVASEYMAAEVLSVFDNRHYTVKFLLKGQSKKFAEWLRKQVDAKVSARGFAHTRRKDINRKHIQSLADRITDRLMETIEENPYEDFYDLNPNNANKGNDMAILPIRKFDAWVTSDSFANSRQAPYGTADYWKWIFAKATGENV